MPQMSPMWWLPLFMMFILTYYMTMMIMYFYNNYNISGKKMINNKIKNISWKW